MSRIDHSTSPQYRQYMRSQTWRNRRSVFFKTHKKECEGCGRRPQRRAWWRFWVPRYFIVVHHVDYAAQIANPGSEPDSDLRAVCSPAHNEIHARYRDGQFDSLEACTEYVLAREKRKREKQLAKLRG